MAFIKHYFNADRPTRALYHMMLNTAVGDELVIETVLESIRRIEHKAEPHTSGLRGVR